MRTIVTTMRNEAPFILEWLSYHKAIGFTDFLVFSNDCDDGTDLILDRLHQMREIFHLPNPRRDDRSIQWTALKRAANHPSVKKAEWIYVADVDEFLNIHAGSGRIEDLLAAHPEADGFLISWRMFGANGQVEFRDELVTRQFTTAAPVQLIWPWRAVQFKALYRNDGTHKGLGVHRPQPGEDRQAKNFHWLDDNGDRVGSPRGTVHLHAAPRYGIAQINHYALGSVESYLVKSDRGKPNHSQDSIDLSYWIDRNFNEIEDRSILRHDAEVSERKSDLLTDPVLLALHSQGVAWRRAKYQELMHQSEPFYLYSRVVQVGDSVSLPMDRQKRLLRQLFAMRRAKAIGEASADTSFE